MIAVTLAPGQFLNFNLLQVFLLIAEHRSFTEAARRTGRSQSAISAQIRQLEDQLAVPLFLRSTRSVALTPYGEMLRVAASASFATLRQGVEEIREMALGDAGRIAIVCSPSVATTLLPPLLKKYKARNADVMIELTEMHSAQMIDPILQGRFAFGIGPMMLSEGDLVFDQLLTDPFVALIPRSMALSRRSTVSLADLAPATLLLPMQGSETRRTLEDAAAESGLVLNVQYECRQYQTLIALVRAGLGVTVLPRTAVDPNGSAEYAVVPIHSAGAFRQIAILAARNRRQSSATQSLIALIKREARAVA